MIAYIVNVFISSWIWGLTFASGYLVINMIVMALCMCCVMRQRVWYSFLLSGIISLVSFILYAGIIFLLEYFFLSDGSLFIGDQSREIVTPWRPSVVLASVYALLQIMLFMMMYMRSPRNSIPYCILALVSNSCSALINYALLKILFWPYL